MSTAEKKSVNRGAVIAQEQFVPDHVFVYVTKGGVRCYDGNKSYTFKTGEYFLTRKNRLAKYTSLITGDVFEKRYFCFEEEFLKLFQEKHKANATGFNSKDTFIKINSSELIANFIRSLNPYYSASGELNKAFVDVKYEELLIILLQNQPELAGIFFDYGEPEKINLEEFMNRNFKFNVSIERFAYLTGRSLSAFKRDFEKIYNETPGHWLLKKRLEEAHFLIDKKKEKSSDIYLDLGFEALSHFSYAFKKQFGLTPTEMAERKKNSSR